MRTKLEPEQSADGLTYVVGVRKGDDDTYQAGCSCGQTSRGWPRRNIAEERIGQHLLEHETGEPAEELAVFMKRHGLATDPAPRDPFAGFAEET